MFHHLSLGTNDLSAASYFYDHVLKTLNISRSATLDQAVAYGANFEFWIGNPINKQTVAPSSGFHLAFNAEDKEQVDAFYQAAIKMGALCGGKPGPRSEYGNGYYAAYVFDLDGHKIEAVFIES